jgi:hypothetical protein
MHKRLKVKQHRNMCSTMQLLEVSRSAGNRERKQPAAAEQPSSQAELFDEATRA